MKSLFKKGVTMLELLVVLVIISILSTIAVGVYSNQIVRAKYARAHSEIRTLETAIASYEVDTGQLPPSSTGSMISPQNLGYVRPYQGSGYLQVALRSSLNGQPKAPLSPRWNGPYVDWDYNRLGNLSGELVTDSTFSGSLAQISFLDPWGSPYYYVRSADYADLGATELPATSPFFATETYYNPSSFQIISFGANGQTNDHPNLGTEPDDVSNFKSSLY